MYKKLVKLIVIIVLTILVIVACLYSYSDYEQVQNSVEIITPTMTISDGITTEYYDGYRIKTKPSGSQVTIYDDGMLAPISPK